MVVVGFGDVVVFDLRVEVGVDLEGWVVVE